MPKLFKQIPMWKKVLYFPTIHYLELLMRELPPGVEYIFNAFATDAELQNTHFAEIYVYVFKLAIRFSQCHSTIGDIAECFCVTGIGVSLLLLLLLGSLRYSSGTVLRVVRNSECIKGELKSGNIHN